MKKTVISLAMMAILASSTSYASGTKPPPDPQGDFAPLFEIFKAWF